MLQRLVRFNRGEVSHRALERRDVERVQGGASRVINFLPERLGGMRNRPGTLRLTDESAAGAEAKAGNRYVPFFNGQDNKALMQVDGGVMSFWGGDDSAIAIESTVGDFGFVIFSRIAGVEGFQEIGLRGVDKAGDATQTITFLVSFNPVRITATNNTSGVDYLESVDFGVGVHHLVFPMAVGDVGKITFHTIIGRTVGVTGVSNVGKPPAEYYSYSQSADTVFFAGADKPFQIERRGLRSWSRTDTLVDDGPFGHINSDETTLQIVQGDKDIGDLSIPIIAESEIESSADLFFAERDEGRLVRCVSKGQRRSQKFSVVGQLSEPVRVVGDESGRNLVIDTEGHIEVVLEKSIDYGGTADGSWSPVNDDKKYGTATSAAGITDTFNDDYLAAAIVWYRLRVTAVGEQVNKSLLVAIDDGLYPAGLASARASASASASASAGCFHNNEYHYSYYNDINKYQVDGTRVDDVFSFGGNNERPHSLISSGRYLYFIERYNSGGQSSRLARLDSNGDITYHGAWASTGVATRIGSANQFGVGEGAPSGLAAIGNTLYMVGYQNAELYSLDVSTGVATRIGSANQFGVGEGAPSGLAAIGNTLYMVGQINDALYSLDVSTGVATRIGSANQFGVGEGAPSGLAAIGNTLYMVGDSNDALYSLDVSTGVATRIGSANRFGVGEYLPSGLAAIGNTLYMVGQINDALYSLDVSTGVATRIGSANQFGVGEGAPSGLAAIGNTLYMVGQINDALYSLDIIPYHIATISDIGYPLILSGETTGRLNLTNSFYTEHVKHKNHNYTFDDRIVKKGDDYFHITTSGEINKWTLANGTGESTINISGLGVSALEVYGVATNAAGIYADIKKTYDSQIYKINPVITRFGYAHLTTDGGSIDGIGRITEVISPTRAKINITKAFGSTQPTRDWYWGEWYNGNYPNSVELHQSRLWYAGKQKIWGSVSDVYDSFDEDVEGDAAAISKTIGFGATDSVLWLKSNGRNLLCGMENQIAMIQSDDYGTALSATNLTIQQASQLGAKAILPELSEGVMYFVHRNGTRIYELKTGVEFEGVSVNDLMLLNPEICESKIKRIALTREPERRLWVVLENGEMRVCLLEPEEKIQAWSRLILEKVGDEQTKILDVCALPGYLEDSVYINTSKNFRKFARFQESQGGARSIHFDDAEFLDKGFGQTGRDIVAAQAAIAAWGGREMEYPGGKDVQWGLAAILGQLHEWIGFGYDIANPDDKSFEDLLNEYPLLPLIEDPSNIERMGGGAQRPPIAILPESKPFQAKGYPVHCQWTSGKIGFGSGRRIRVTSSALGLTNAIPEGIYVGWRNLQTGRHKVYALGKSLRRPINQPKSAEGIEAMTVAEYDNVDFQFDGSNEIDERIEIQTVYPAHIQRLSYDIYGEGLGDDRQNRDEDEAKR